MPMDMKETYSTEYFDALRVREMGIAFESTVEVFPILAHNVIK
jgi:hypothetical protein